DLRRTVLSRGLVELPPMQVDPAVPSLALTLAAGKGSARTVEIEPGRAGRVRISLVGRAPSALAANGLIARVRHVLRLDEDLSEFYGLVASDPELSWAASGAGRWVRSPTVFEDVIKTVCTTNCTWSATELMVGALVEHLGAEAPGGRHAFPTPAAMAGAD